MLLRASVAPLARLVRSPIVPAASALHRFAAGGKRACCIKNASSCLRLKCSGQSSKVAQTKLPTSGCFGLCWAACLCRAPTFVSSDRASLSHRRQAPHFVPQTHCCSVQHQVVKGLVLDSRMCGIMLYTCHRCQTLRASVDAGKTSRTKGRLSERRAHTARWCFSVAKTAASLSPVHSG